MQRDVRNKEYVFSAALREKNGRIAEKEFPVVRIISVNPLNPARSEIAEAVRILRAGGIVAYPTETFYGLAVDSGNEAAIEKIFVAKGRDEKAPISLIIAIESQLAPLVKTIPATARRLAERFWPGGITMLFEASPTLSKRLLAGTGKIGIRLSNNVVASLLARELGSAVTATSANKSGEKECVTAHEVSEALGDHIDAVIDGGATPGPPGTTIVDATVDPPRVLREGTVSRETIMRCLSGKT